MRVAIDAGHGYNTPGKESPEFVRTVTNTYAGNTVIVRRGERFREHVANAGVAYFLSKELERCGVEVIKSAWNGLDASNDNTDPSIVTRQMVIRNANCDYSISIHYNAYKNTFNSARGCETFYHAEENKVGDGKQFAETIHSQLAQTFTDQVNRGVKNTSRLGMCNSVGMKVKASCLIECAFMTNQEEAEKYFANPYAWYKYAVSIAKGFCNYTGIPYVQYIPEAPIIKSSSRKDVAWLQDKLNEHGANLVVDGIYGPLTSNAVLEYQKWKGWKIPKNATGYYTGAGTIVSLSY